MRRRQALLATLLLTAPLPRLHAAPWQGALFDLPASPGEAALQKHDLAWIKTGRDFDQTTMDEYQLEGAIWRVIEAYGKEAPIATFEVPINSKKLKYLGKKKYAQFAPALALSSDTKPGGALDREAHFWSYGDVSIAVPEDNTIGQFFVYSLARSLELLKNRYPVAYRNLLIASRGFISESEVIGEKYRERYASLIFSFDERPTSIASSSQVFQKGKTLPSGFTEYLYTGVISFHERNILGRERAGSRPLYQKPPEESAMRYLREGMVETIVHEMLHRYFAVRKEYHAESRALYYARNNPRPFNSEWEEIYVANTSLSYFLRQGGLQPFIPYYYRGVLERNLSLLKSLQNHGVSTDIEAEGPLKGRSSLDTMRLALLDS